MNIYIYYSDYFCLNIIIHIVHYETVQLMINHAFVRANYIHCHRTRILGL